MDGFEIENCCNGKGNSNENKFPKIIFIQQLHGITQRIGYPNGLDNNITDLEKTYAQVQFIQLISYSIEFLIFGSIN